MAGVTSSYPAALDSESNLTPPNNGDTLSVADHWLAGNSGPIVAIETELGTDPAGYATDVKTRLDDINPSEGNLNLDAGYGSKAPIYGVRAWVNFDGTTNVSGNCTIRASANVSSVADNSTGNYTVNFTSAMPDANYSVVGQHKPDYALFTGNAAPRTQYLISQGTSSFTVEHGYQSAPSVNTDSPIVCYSVLR